MQTALTDEDDIKPDCPHCFDFEFLCEGCGQPPLLCSCWVKGPWQACKWCCGVVGDK